MTQASRVTPTKTQATPVAAKPPAQAPAAKPKAASAQPKKAVSTSDSASFSNDAPKTLRRQDRYTLVADLVGCRIYVLDKKTGDPVDSYLISPGTAAHPTRGNHMVIDRTVVKGPWNPPKSDWAKNAKPVPGGENNPMGIFKMSLGGYSEYIHGTPKSERKDLGRPASHGCLRMSNENVLQLFERYAGVGTEVNLIRDAKESARLKEAFAAMGIHEHAITDGAELLPAAIAGKAPVPLE